LPQVATPPGRSPLTRQRVALAVLVLLVVLVVLVVGKRL
jgi:hypothetical protein